MGYAIQLRTVSLPAYVLLAGMLSLALTAPAGAQPPPTPAGVSTPAAPPAPVVGGTSAGRFPAPPTGFFRGNSFANPTLTGFYFGWFRLIYLVGLFFLWVWTCRWIDEDAHGLKVRPMFWNTIALFGGTAGFVLALCMPAFPVAFLVMTTAYALPMGLYVYERNQRVPDSGKVLTPRHLKSVGLRLLGRLGIKFGTREVREAIGGPPIRLIGKSGKGAGEVDRSKQVESSGGYLAARELIYDAILRRTTDIHLEPKEDEISVRLRVDGVMYPAEPFDRSTGDAIINIFKVLGAMDITERRKPQDGSFRAETEGRQIDFRVATQGVQFGEKMSLRILDQGSSVKTLPMLGLRKQLMEQVAEIVHQPHGMFLSCGPTGAGKSTTLYAALQEIDALESNIITIEDPVEYKMANVTQIEINTKAGQTFAGSLRSVLRQDPDVLLVGEIRDAETAKIACQASTTGHMVFSTLHANDTVTALFRLIDLGVEPFLLASSLSAILGQRLVRKLCEDCREPYRPDVELLHTLGLPAEKVDKFYRPPKSGNACPTCSGMGYFGRMGVFELLVMTDRLRDMIRETPNLAAIKAEARKNGMLYMIEEGLRLVVKGTTSLEELRRVAK